MEEEKKSIWQKIRNNKKIAIIIVSGLVIGASATVYGAAQTDSWNIGDGWMFFKTASNSEVRANTSDPVDAGNIATKGYVDAATGGGGTDKFTAYGVTSCPAGWSVAYTGQLYGVYASTENSITSSDGSTGGGDVIICAGTSRTARANPENTGPYGSMNGDRWFIPLGNWDDWTGYMDCAVCIR